MNCGSIPHIYDEIEYFVDDNKEQERTFILKGGCTFTLSFALKPFYKGVAIGDKVLIDLSGWWKEGVMQASIQARRDTPFPQQDDSDLYLDLPVINRGRPMNIVVGNGTVIRSPILDALNAARAAAPKT